ncbi:MAG: YihY/virulence factor BrkB family protein [Planctomycetota bacterium]|nr:MAG: YihY/virulence factor BrkB family protein [Planctomycetota bacterium]
MGKNKKKQTSLWRSLVWFFTLLFRPFYDFYFNYGMAKASTLAYVFCANLVLFLYILLGFNITSSINPFHSEFSSQRFLEVHFLWPMEAKVLIKETAPGFSLYEGAVVSQEQFQRAVKKYEREYKKKPAIKTEPFSIGKRLGKRAHENLMNFQKQISNSWIGAPIFVLFVIAYIALLLSTTNILGEVDTPLIRGNMPLFVRQGQLTRWRWIVPSWRTIKNHIGILFMLPMVSLAIVGLITGLQSQLDRFINPYGDVNLAITIGISFFLITALFFVFYKFSLSEISNIKLLVGAIIASGFWLLGRWLFTTFTAVSFERSLHNFVFIPLLLTWLYYFCVIFIVGAHIAHTLEYPYLSSVARMWIRKEVVSHYHFSRLANWIKIEFLLELARLWHDPKAKKKELILRIGKKKKKSSEDIADKIAKHCHLHPTFVREVLLEMIVKHMFLIERTFRNRKKDFRQEEIKAKEVEDCYFKVESDNRFTQKCQLLKAPKMIPLRVLLEETKKEREEVLPEVEDYEIPYFVEDHYHLPEMSLEDLYQKALEEGLFDNKEEKSSLKNLKEKLVPGGFRKKREKTEEPLETGSEEARKELGKALGEESEKGEEELRESKKEETEIKEEAKEEQSPSIKDERKELPKDELKKGFSKIPEKEEEKRVEKQAEIQEASLDLNSGKQEEEKEEGEIKTEKDLGSPSVKEKEEGEAKEAILSGAKETIDDKEREVKDIIEEKKTEGNLEKKLAEEQEKPFSISSSLSLEKVDIKINGEEETEKIENKEGEEKKDDNPSLGGLG